MDSCSCSRRPDATTWWALENRRAGSGGNCVSSSLRSVVHPQKRFSSRRSSRRQTRPSASMLTDASRPMFVRNLAIVDIKEAIEALGSDGCHCHLAEFVRTQGLHIVHSKVGLSAHLHISGKIGERFWSLSAAIKRRPCRLSPIPVDSPGAVFECRFERKQRWCSLSQTICEADLCVLRPIVLVVYDTGQKTVPHRHLVVMPNVCDWTAR